MSETRLWNCDGCGDKADATTRNPPDWKNVTIEVSGLEGYPTCQLDEGEKEYHLCPVCAKQLQRDMNPRLWPRVAQEAAPQ
jgi:ribosomal protein L37AE/L43A